MISTSTGTASVDTREGFSMMNNWYCTANMSTMLAEDAGAPELRNPIHSGIRARGWLFRLIFKSRRG